MSTKVGINGFGRIGRHVLRIGLKEKELEFVGINDISDPKTLAHLFKYDSTFGPCKSEVKSENGHILVDNKPIRVFSEKNPSDIPWGETGAQVIAESSGVFRSKEQASAHLGKTVKKVIITAPAKGNVDFTTVLGVNQDKYENASHNIISNASCTTNCFAMIVKVLHENFRICKGQMTTVHSYTNDQQVLDAPHKDLRRSRAAAVSIIPTSTGAADAINIIYPELKGKMSAISMRVPTANVSVVDFTCEVEKPTNAEEVNEKFRTASKEELNGYLRYVGEELVSSDFIGDSHSASIDAPLTSVVEGNLVKVIGWYDNEYGYSSRVVDLLKFIGDQI